MSLFGKIFGESKGGGSTVDEAQQPFLQFLREQAQGQFEQYGQQQTEAGFGLAENLTGQGQGFIDQLGQAGSGLDQFVNNQGFVDQQVESLTDILNRNLGQNLQGIQSQFGMSGAGGSRTGVAAGTALGDTQLALSAGVSDILQGNLQRQQDAAGMQGMLQNQGNMAGFDALTPQFNMGMAGFTNAQQPLGNFANLIGQPTILGTGTRSTPGIMGSLSANFER